MSRRAWLTPDDVPGAAQCRPVSVPDGLHYEAAFRGAFLLLCDPENWEGHGTQTPETCAAAFYTAFLSTLDNWGACPTGGKVIGEIFLWPSGTPPTGCLACDWSYLDPDAYPDLYAVIGFTFGNDGFGNFRLPDLRGRMPIGAGQGVGLTDRVLAEMDGQEDVTLQIYQMPAHTHTVKRQATTGGTPALTNAISATWTEFETSSEGEDGAHTNMPPYTVLTYVIQAL